MKWKRTYTPSNTANMIIIQWGLELGRLHFIHYVHLILFKLMMKMFTREETWCSRRGEKKGGEGGRETCVAQKQKTWGWKSPWTSDQLNGERMQRLPFTLSRRDRERKIDTKVICNHRTDSLKCGQWERSPYLSLDPFVLPLSKVKCIYRAAMQSIDSRVKMHFISSFIAISLPFSCGEDRQPLSRIV